MYNPVSLVITGLKICGLIYVDPFCCSPLNPPGGLMNSISTVAIIVNLSTTPSSMQVMVKLSPAVGTPGIMTRGMKRPLLSAEQAMDHWPH